MACRKTKSGRKKYCIGDFRHHVKIIDPEILETKECHDISNDDIVLQTKAKLKTSSGIQSFNGVSIDTGTTHKFTIRYTSATIEKRFMILHKGNLYKIESVENENEDDLYLIIQASKGGDKDLSANLI